MIYGGLQHPCARRLGIPVIGIEIEEKFCELAVSRLKQGQLELMEATA